MKKILIIAILCSFSFLVANETDKKLEESLKKIANSQIIKISDKANNTKSENEKNIKGFVLSTNIKTFSDISKDVDTEIANMKEQLEILIKQVAQDIEIHNGVSGTLTLHSDGRIEYIPNKDLPKALNDKREKLLKSNLENSVSIRSASLAFSLLADINKEIKKNALKATTRKDKEGFYMKQAIFVYEMTDIVINLLDKLTLSGKENIETIYKDSKVKLKARISQIEKQQSKTKELVKSGDIPKSQLKPSLKRLDAMINAQSRVLTTWEDVMKKVGKQDQYLKKLKSKNKLLHYYKDNAKLQIETLRDFRALANLQDAIGSLDDLIDTVSSLDLLVLDDKTVSQLLGIDFK